MRNLEEVLLLMFNENGESIKVGELTKKGNKFYFKYDKNGVKKATELGFKTLDGFPKIDAEYFREEMFVGFSERVVKDNLNNDEIFELLKSTGGKISEDNLQFVDPNNNIKEEKEDI